MTPIPVHVVFRGMAHSAALEAEVRERTAWLEQFYGRMLDCRVRLAVPHRHHRVGRHLHVQISLTVPGGGPVVVCHEGADVTARAAVHEAFDAARRRLQDFAREQRGAVKAHAGAAS